MDASSEKSPAGQPATDIPAILRKMMDDARAEKNAAAERDKVVKSGIKPSAGSEAHAAPAEGAVGGGTSGPKSASAAMPSIETPYPVDTLLSSNLDPKVALPVTTADDVGSSHVVRTIPSMEGLAPDSLNPLHMGADAGGEQASLGRGDIEYGVESSGPGSAFATPIETPKLEKAEFPVAPPEEVQSPHSALRKQSTASLTSRITSSLQTALANAEGPLKETLLKAQGPLQDTLSKAQGPIKSTISKAQQPINEALHKAEVPVANAMSALEQQIHKVLATQPPPPETESGIASDLKRALPRAAEYLMTLNPVISLALMAGASLIGWSIGNLGWSWLWVLILSVSGVLYVTKLRTTMSQAVSFETKRNEAILALGNRPESAEWVNFFIQQLWPIIDPQLFADIIDVLEDQFIAEAPSFITRIHIADFDLGPHAPKITSMQVYPGASGEDAVLMDVALKMQPTPQELAQKSHLNTHLLLVISMGSHKLGSVSIPILAEVAEFEAKARLHIQFTSQMPFVKTVKFTLLETPHLEFGVKPLKVGNIMNLPLLSQFIMSTTEKVIHDLLVSPKVMAIEVDKLLDNTNIKALGVVKVVFRQARNLHGSDVGGSADPYATLSFAKNSRSLARTRIIPNEKNPVWNETHYVLLTEEDVKNGIPLVAKIWDHDNMRPDDELGRFSLKIEDLVDSEGVLFDGWKSLLNKKDEDSKMRKMGELDFQIGFFPKLEKASRKEDSEKYSGGILQLWVHECADLLLRPKDRNGLYVNPFVHVYINDKQTFSTRIKHSNPSPVYNSSTEIFIRDWRHTRVRIVVKDSRMHEHDVVIGVVVVELGDVLARSEPMMFTSWNPLSGGIGFGKVRTTFMFQPVKLDEPEHLTGWDVGELEIKDLKISSLSFVTKDESHAPSVYVRVRSPLTDPTKARTKTSPRNTLQPDFSSEDPMKLHLTHRYQTPLRFEIRQRASIFTGDKTIAVGKMFCQDLVDGQPKQVVLALRRWVRRVKGSGLELGGESTDLTRPGDVDPTVGESVVNETAGGKVEGGRAIASDDDQLEGGKEEDFDQNDEGESDEDGETESITSGFSETIASSSPGDDITSHGAPTLSFTATFRPGQTWVQNRNEGEEAYLDATKHNTEASDTRAQLSSVTEKERKHMHGVGKRLFTLSDTAITVPAGKSAGKEEKGAAKERMKRESPGGDKLLKGTHTTRSMAWGKDMLVDGVKQSVVGKVASKKVV
ncbi:hypothetical protein HK104_009543 [Borealophlyctis nickersoniae]|nr:hypothetical protein HK104_009543 [Borealophlyctis nickersoniae]